ncbi:MAG: hypothetical protein FD166_1883 [Bacteroidetes bacterium]|nr:MAG: hypothetical protein FD166_1883 [Bacteroidota bacterium]
MLSPEREAAFFHYKKSIKFTPSKKAGNKCNKVFRKDIADK